MWSLLWWNISRSPTEFILEPGSAFEVGWIHLSKFQQLEGVYERLDERAQKWMKQNPHYNDPIRLGDWLQCCMRALTHLKVRLSVIVLGTLGVFRIVGPEFGALGQLYKAWSLEDLLLSVLTYLLITPISLVPNIHISRYCLGSRTVPTSLS